jgi:hypothetical protein
LRARWKYRLKQIGSLRFCFGFAQTPALTGECPDPIDIKSAIRKEYASRSEIFNALPFREAVLRRGPVAAREGKAGAEVAGTVTLYRTKKYSEHLQKNSTPSEARFQVRHPICGYAAVTR